jgi:hypothetical protein
MRISRSAAAAGMFLVLAGLNACGDDLSVKPLVVPVPKTLTVTTATNNQTGFVTAGLAENPTVSIADAKGLPIIGYPVAWKVESGGGTLGDAATAVDTVTTNSFGESTVAWTLGNTVGAQTISATVVGQPTINATFTATAVQPNFAISSGDNQTAAAGDTVTDNPTIIVTDANGDPVQNVRVDFAIASGGGFLSSAAADTALTASLVTDAKGLAGIVWVLGPTIGTQTLTATVGDATPVTFTAIATVPTAFNFDASGRVLFASNRVVRIRLPWVGARSQ